MRLALAVVTVALVAGCGGGSKPAAKAPPPASARMIHLTGDLALPIPENVYNRDTYPCNGVGGYTDIAEGTAVTVEDAGGKVIATTTLNSGQNRTERCYFGFAADVPPSAFYKVEVSQVEAGDVHLTLGS